MFDEQSITDRSENKEETEITRPNRRVTSAAI